jgi:hypothetical protein
MTDLQIMVIALFLFAYLFLFALGIAEAAIFGVLAGIVGFFLALEILTVTGDATLALIFGAIALFTLIAGIGGMVAEVGG